MRVSFPSNVGSLGWWGEAAEGSQLAPTACDSTVFSYKPLLKSLSYKLFINCFKTSRKQVGQTLPVPDGSADFRCCSLHGPLLVPQTPKDV